MPRAIVILLCAVLSSCQLWRVDGLMDTAERQMGCAVDSALITMRTVKRYAVLTPQRRARYGLLYSVALDKNYIDVASDSLIRYSAEYYDRKGTPHQRLKAYYYLGRTQENAKQYQKALLSFLDAAQYADQVEDKYLCGLVYSNLARVYYYTYNYNKAYECAEKSSSFYKAAGMKRHQAYQLYAMGLAANGLTQYDKAYSPLKRATTIAEEIGDTTLLMTAYMQLQATYNDAGRYNDSYELLKQCEKKFGDALYESSSMCGAAANTMAAKRYDKKVDELLEKGWKLSKNLDDTIMMHHYVSRVEFIRGRSLEGYEEYSIALRSRLEELVRGLESAISVNSTEFFSEKEIRTKANIQRSKTIYKSIIIALVVLGAAMVLFRHLYAKNRERQLRVQIESKIAVIEDIRRDFAALNADMSESLRTATEREFEIFNQLCQTYYENTNNSKKQLAVFRRVEELISEIYNGEESFATIENSVNRSRNNILEDAKAEIPLLTADEYKLMCYICAGFSTQAVCLFFDCTPSAVYNRLSRLRKKIKSSNSSRIEEYLDCLH